MRQSTRLLTLSIATMAISLAAPTAAHASAGFGDVEAGSYYEIPVAWMVDKDVTTGVEPGCFAPGDDVTRGQIAAFLYRLDQALGATPSGTDHPFVDLAAPWQDAPVAWMYGLGITTGTTPTTFAPNAPVTRGDFAVFLWRYAGNPAPSSPHGFVDVTRARQNDAVAWMAEHDITTGTTATTFEPDATMTRAQAAAFMWRFADRPDVTEATLADPGESCTKKLREALVDGGLTQTEASCAVVYLADYTVEELSAVLIGATAPSIPMLIDVSAAAQACLSPDRVEELTRLLF